MQSFAKEQDNRFPHFSLCSHFSELKLVGKHTEAIWSMNTNLSRRSQQRNKWKEKSELHKIKSSKYSCVLTIPNATPLKAVWNSKLGVGSCGVG